MRKILPLLLVLLTSLGASGKLTKFILRGYVAKQDYSKNEWQKEDVDSVFVSLVQNDTVAVPFRMLKGDDDMKMTTDYELRMMVDGGVGSYTLFLNKEGFEPLRHDFKVTSEGQDVVFLRTLDMEPRRENTLNEVTITGTAIKMVMKGDTIVYDSAAFKLPEGSTLDALVAQLPGAQLADDGSITVNGKKVSSLLLNGQDFFKGDPDVALKNLPSYTVDKIKVYDKAEKDDYLTNASQRLTDSPEEENLVMDVQLKKEFSMATILSVEGGYGPGIYKSDDPKRYDSRYIGRAFLVGFGKNYRFSAFGNVNNIMNTSRASSENKGWGHSWGWNPSGDAVIKMGGLDVFYEPSKKLEISANMQYTREDINTQTLTSNTRFYPTGNLYSRSRTETAETRDHIEGGAILRYKGDNVFITFMPSVDWKKTSETMFNYTANFSRNPEEESRGAALDSLFSLRAGLEPSELLRESVTSSHYTSRQGTLSSIPDQLNLGARLNARWTPKSIRGSFTLFGYVDDKDKKAHNGRLDIQEVAEATPGYTPLHREQRTHANTRETYATGSLGYEWSKRFFGSSRSHELSVNAEGVWKMERTSQDNVMEIEALADAINAGSRPLPSMTAPENLRHLTDPENTLNLLKLNNSAGGLASVVYRSEVIAPGDSSVNLSYRIGGTFTHTQWFRHLSYNKPLLDPAFHVGESDNRPTEKVNASFSINSNNKVRFLSWYTGYTYEQALVDMLMLLPTRNSTDPFHIYEGPREGEKFANPASHNLNSSFFYYNRKSHESASLDFYYSRTADATAHTSVFDPATGITTHRPMTINGNWYTRLSGGFRKSFGYLECWTAGISANWNHINSVDYVASVGEPERSLVKTDNLGGDLSLSYKIPDNGTYFRVTGGTTWQHSVSPRAGFIPISATESFVKAEIDFYLPWQIEGETSLRGNFRRGYEDNALNRTDWIWNASVQKSVLKGALTFKITAVDLLGQLTSVNYSVNAQGRTEVWTNSLPRYAMLTISYRFNFMPKAMQ